MKRESADVSRPLEPRRPNSGRQVNVDKKIQAPVTVRTESSSQVNQLAKEANVATISESGLLSVKGAQAFAGQSTSAAGKFSLDAAQLVGISEKSDGYPTVTDLSNAIESPATEKQVGGNNYGAPRTGNDTGKALAPQTTGFSVATEGLQSGESLLRALDATLITDAQVKKDTDASGAAGNSESNTLKALEQLSSAKSIAPNIMRVINADKASQKQGKRAGDSASKAVSPTVSSVGPSGTLLQDGVLAPVKPVSVTQGANLSPGSLSSEMIALQNGAFKDATTIDGKNAGLDGAFQLQPDKAGLSSEAKENGVIRAGKLILPESFASKLKSGMNSLRLQIAPKHLGPAQLTVKLIKDHVSGTLTVANEAAKVAALNSLDSLTQRLSAEGFTLDALNVDVQQGGSGQAQQEMNDRYAGLLQSSLALRTIEDIDSLNTMGDSALNLSRSDDAGGDRGVLSAIEVNMLA